MRRVAIVVIAAVIALMSCFSQTRPESPMAGPTAAGRGVATAAWNGTDWSLLSDCTVTEAETEVRMRMDAGRGSSSSTTSAHFDNFNSKTCPPL